MLMLPDECRGIACSTAGHYQGFHAVMSNVTLILPPPTPPPPLSPQGEGGGACIHLNSTIQGPDRMLRSSGPGRVPEDHALFMRGCLIFVRIQNAREQSRLGQELWFPPWQCGCRGSEWGLQCIVGGGTGNRDATQALLIT